MKEWLRNIWTLFNLTIIFCRQDSFIFIYDITNILSHLLPQLTFYCIVINKTDIIDDIIGDEVLHCIFIIQSFLKMKFCSFFAFFTIVKRCNFSLLNFCQYAFHSVESISFLKVNMFLPLSRHIFYLVLILSIISECLLAICQVRWFKMDF